MDFTYLQLVFPYGFRYYFWIFSTFCTTNKCETNMQTLPNQPMCAFEIGNQQSSIVTLIAVFVLTFSSSMGKYMHIYLKTIFFVILFIWNASVGLLDCSWTICHSENDITIFLCWSSFRCFTYKFYTVFFITFPCFWLYFMFCKNICALRLR